METVPEIDANCFAIEGESLTAFMQVIASVALDGQRPELGSYTLDKNATAYLNGNKFFQRHAVVVGSTGSGKSWTTARILEQVAALPNANALVFDLHGEYTPLSSDRIRHFRIAGPGELDQEKSLKEGVVYLPYWLLGYEAMISTNYVLNCVGGWYPGRSHTRSHTGPILLLGAQVISNP